MSMESTHIKIEYSALDADGNGQKIAFEQIGATYEMLLSFQGQVVAPLVQNLTALGNAWRDAAAKG